jgi:SAM-dependent methyltransferase
MSARTLLHVGCGPLRKADTTPGFNTPAWRELRLDIDPSVEPDIIGTMTDMSAVADKSVDAIFSSHNIEHLYPFEVPVALREFRRVLKPDGFAVITCPDLQSVAELIAADKLLETAYTSPLGPISPIDIVYGHRRAMADGNLYMAHRCGFTLRTLVGLLNEMGFANVAGRRRRAHLDLWTLAMVNGSEAEAKALTAEHWPPD